MELMCFLMHDVPRSSLDPRTTPRTSNYDLIKWPETRRILYKTSERLLLRFAHFPEKLYPWRRRATPRCLYSAKPSHCNGQSVGLAAAVARRGALRRRPANRDTCFA